MIQVKTTIRVAALIAITVKTHTPIVLPLFRVAMTHLQATRSSYLDLREPNALSPSVLLQEHASELRKSFRRIVEGAKDALAVVYRQRDDHDRAFDCVPEDGGSRLVDEAGELANVLVADSDSGEHQQVEASS